MPRLADLRAGDGIWIDHFGLHPAVVLVAGRDSIQVICGTSKFKPGRKLVRIEPRSPAAFALGLSQTTYFYRSNLAVITDSSVVKRVAKRCPPGKFRELEVLAVTAAHEELAVSGFEETSSQPAELGGAAPSVDEAVQVPTPIDDTK